MAKPSCTRLLFWNKVHWKDSKNPEWTWLMSFRHVHKIPFSWIDLCCMFWAIGQMHFVYLLSLSLYQRTRFIALTKFSSHFPWNNPKTEACKTAIPFLLFFKHWPPGTHPTSGLTLEMKKNTKTSWEIPTLFRTEFKCSSVIKCLKNHDLWGSLQLWACSSALWICLSAIHEMHNIKMQFWELH